MTLPKKACKFHRPGMGPIPLFVKVISTYNFYALKTNKAGEHV
jgi:hypothetical protein